jgi:tripartite-type tricarboxylate transporter receptor subunit TctC
MHSKPRQWIIGPACALMLAASAASAQEFPAKAVKVIVPFPPGGPVDVLARALGEGFRERTGQSFVVDNKPGGATAIGANACKNAEPTATRSVC